MTDTPYPTATLSPAQVAKAFGVAPNTVYRWIDNGVITAPKREFTGLKRRYVFTETWLDIAKQELETYRTSSKN